MSIWRMRIAILLIIAGLLLVLISHRTKAPKPDQYRHQKGGITQTNLSQPINYQSIQFRLV